METTENYSVRIHMLFCIHNNNNRQHITYSWLLNKIAFVQEVGIHVYVHPSPTSEVIWIPYDWLNMFYSFYIYMAIVVIISSRGLTIEVHCKLTE